MSEKRKKYDREFREGAVRIVEETGKPIAQVVRDLGVVEGTLGNWVKLARESRDGSSSLSKDDYAELGRAEGPAAASGLHTDRARRRDSVDRAVKTAFDRAVACTAHLACSPICVRTGGR